nr:MAG TPA: minor capsid protein [Caudoviricetes sp.]
MLTPEYLLHISEGAEQIAESLHIDIIKRIIAAIMIRLDRGDDYILTPRDKWMLEVLQDAGILFEDIVKEIAQKTGLQRTEIQKAMEAACVTNMQYENALFSAVGIVTNDFTKSPYMLRLMQSTYQATIGEWSNFARVMASEAEQSFIKACDKAYIEVTTGAISYTQAVKEAVEELAANGVEVVYPSGHRDTIETATLRAVRTGVSRAAAQITIARADEEGEDLVLVSAHLGARPEHHVWQGKVYSRSGTDARYPDFVQSTRYGEVDGLCGANCRHHFSVYMEGMTNPYENYDTEENRLAYDLQQRQRALERRIRKTKRETMGLKAALDNAQTPETAATLAEAYSKKAAQLEKQNAAYKKFCAENDLKELQDRISIARWDRKQAASARGAARKYNSKLEKQEQYDKMVSEIKEAGYIPKNATVNIPPRKIDTKSLSFDDNHINKERQHNVNREMAETWIYESKMSAGVWNGRFERYYSKNGSSYVDLQKNEIRTAFSKEEFDENVKGILEALDKYEY